MATLLGLEYPEGFREAQALLAHVMALSRAQVAARGREGIDHAVRATYQSLMERRCQGEPCAYLVGRREFYGLDFLVTPAALIPRPETELLVEAALARLLPDRPARVLDLGTGSGILAITIAHLRPQAQVTAVDASRDALDLAAENAARLGTGRIRFLESDWYSALGAERFDVIVSNPPYIPADDPHLDRGDLRFEPRRALVAGKDGLDCIRTLAQLAPLHLESMGWLLFEHGYDQAATCRDLLDRARFDRVFTMADLAGIERVSCGQIGLR